MRKKILISMIIIIVLVVSVILIVFLSKRDYISSEDKEALQSVPSSVSEKYGNIKQEYRWIQEKTISSCIKDDNIIYLVEGVDFREIDIGVRYYFAGNGDYIGLREFSDAIRPGTPPPPVVDLKGYQCEIIIES